MKTNVKEKLKNFIGLLLIAVCISIFVAIQMEMDSRPKDNSPQLNMKQSNKTDNSTITDFSPEYDNNFASAYMNSEIEYVFPGNEISIPFTVETSAEIKDYTYSCEGITVLSDYQTPIGIEFNTIFMANAENYGLTVNINLSDGQNITTALYTFKTEIGIFISRYSSDDALSKYLKYALKKGILTEDEALALEMESYEDCIKYVTMGGSAREISSGVQTLGTADTYAHGILQWEDDFGNLHLLRKVKVEIRDSDAVGTDLLATTYTDNNGYYSAAFDNSTFMEEKSDLFLRIFPGDGNVTVYKSDGTTEYSMDTDHEGNQNVNTGSDTEISFIIEKTEVNIVQAMQIGQAVLTARDFAKEMKGSQPEAVKVCYPYGDTQYFRSNKTITIDRKLPNSGMPNSYASWDTIMHEYGHHISYEMNIIDSPGEWHAINSNMIDHYLGNDTSACGSECARHKSGGFSASEAKIQGEKIAWSESWATVFGLIAQDYYKNNLGGIPTVCNGKYEAYNLLAAYEIESCGNFLGEGCEGSIAAVLWDLFDSGDEESKDTISLGYQKWWNVTTGSQATTFSSFMKYFYSRYWKYIGEVGKNLEYYAMAPAIRVVNAVDEINANMSAMRFLWEPQGGSDIYKNNNFQLLFYNEDFTDKYTLSVGNATLQDIDSSIFNNIKELKGQVVHVAIRGYHSSNSIYDGYVSSCIDLPKRVFTYSLNGDKATITGAYCDLIGTITIPATIDGYQIEAIGESAFQYKSFNVIGFANDSIVHTLGNYAFNSCPNLTIFNAPSSLVSVGNYVFTYCKPITFSYPGTTLTTIGKGAFMNTEMPLHMFIPESIETIGTYAFKNSSFNDKFALRPNSALRSIGSYAFENHTMKRIVLSNAVSDIGTGAFNGCENITIYTERSARPSTWDMYWNGSNRPVFWGCTLSSDKSYVVSFVKSSSNPANSTAINGISTPFRKGYTFNGWYTTSDFSGTQYTDVTAAPNGTLYAKWTEDSCVAEGSLITLADGSRVAVENLTGNEDLLVWNMLTGQFDVAPILFIDSDPVSSYEIIKLTFSDGTFVKVIDEHAFFDMTLNKYVFLRNDAAQYIGHTFNKQTVGENGENVWAAVTLTDVTVYTETTTAWSPVTYGHLCYYVNGMLSMPGATEGFINIFEVDPTTMKYDEAQMAEDIAEYGLYTYEEFNEIIPLPEVVFNAFNGQYLKVSIGKGLITLDEIRALIERYSAVFAI